MSKLYVYEGTGDHSYCPALRLVKGENEPLDIPEDSFIKAPGSTGPLQEHPGSFGRLNSIAVKAAGCFLE